MSKTIIDQCLVELGCKFELLETFLEQRVSFGRIFKEDSPFESFGSGNGELHSIKVIAECIEHSFLNFDSEIFASNLSKIANQSQFKNDSILKEINNGSLDIDTYSFLDLKSKNTVYVPAIYGNLKYAKICPELRPLYSSSGFSFGLSKESARQHAILEVIERHELSNLFYKLDNKIPFDISFYQIPVESLNSKFNGSIEMYCISSCFNLPTFLCVFFPHQTNHKILFPQTSSKSGFNIEETANGALSEMIQILCLYSDEEFEEDNTIFNDKQLIDKYKNSLFLNTLKDPSRFSVFKQEFKITQISDLLETLWRNDFFPLERLIFNFKNSCVVLQIYIPGMDKYNLIRLGKVTPVNKNFKAYK